MAIQVNVAGKTQIQVDTGDAHAMERLGWTRGGVETVKEAFWIDVPGDEHGGDEGPPVDVQYIGEIARVRMELTKYDPDVLAKIMRRLWDESATAGTPKTPGTLVFGNTRAFRLLLYSITSGMRRNFPRAFPRMPVELNRGTKFSTLVMEWECHKNGSGVLYNTSVSGAITTDFTAITLP